MKKLLFSLVVLLSIKVEAQTDTTTQYKTTSIDIICSPAKDTIYIINKSQMEVFITIWDLPEYVKDKPVFVYKTQEEIEIMSKLPRYQRREEE